MKFTIIDPGFLGEYGIGKWGKGYWSTAINHGVAQISAVCKSSGIESTLIDFRRMSSYEQFRAEVKNDRSDWYGITCRTIDVPIVAKAVDIIREERPSAKIIVGGMHASLLPEYFLLNNKIDYVFTGEADSTLPSLIMDPIKYSRLVTGEIPDINQIPFEDISIYDYSKSISFSLYGGIVTPPMIPIITSRGCIYNCKFCQPAEKLLYGAKYRQKCAERVLEEIRNILRLYYFNSIMFYDDCLLAHKKYLMELLTGLTKFKKVDVMLQGRANNICVLGDEISELKKLGLKAVIIGFESGSQRVLDFIGKGTTVEQNVMASEILHRHNIKIIGNFMIGLPTETREEIDETVELANKINPTIASCSFYSPMPGSYIYDYCVKNDLILEKDFAKLSRDPRKAKIKGVDYNFASKALCKIVGSRFKNRIVKNIVGYAYMNLERGAVRENFTRIYNKFVE